MKKLILILLLSGCTTLCFAQTGDFYTIYLSANALLAKGHYDKAIEKYNEAQKLGNMAYVYYNRGNAYAGKKDYTNAISDYSKTIKINDKYAEAYAQRGMIKLTTKDKTACDDLKKASRLGYEDMDSKEAIRINCK